jgi:hypothetical protein
LMLLLWLVVLLLKLLWLGVLRLMLRCARGLLRTGGLHGLLVSGEYLSCRLWLTIHLLTLCS